MKSCHFSAWGQTKFHCYSVTGVDSCQLTSSWRVLIKLLGGHLIVNTLQELEECCKMVNSRKLSQLRENIHVSSGGRLRQKVGAGELGLLFVCSGDQRLQYPILCICEPVPRSLLASSAILYSNVYVLTCLP